MTGLEALGVIDGLIARTAHLANAAAGAIEGFDEIGAGAGVGIRLKALYDVRAALVVAGLEEHERLAAWGV